MNEIVLAGSLSNDLFRVASLTQRGATKAAERFIQESKKWAKPLSQKNVPGYIKNIASDIASSDNEINMKTAEKYLMYGVLLQNYSLNKLKK